MGMSTLQTPWRFYGRHSELAALKAIFERQRWFFVQISGRRRIGKTALVQQALEQAHREKSVYMQIPDSDAVGVLAACNDYLQTFDIEQQARSLAELAQIVAQLVRQGYVVAIDEFQYFHRSKLIEFCSYLQAQVDALSRQADKIQGGLIVLGSLHAEMSALLEDRVAPLFNRTTDKIQLDHLDIESLLQMLSIHADCAPERVLFLWSLFEGIPKFYRDAYEQQVLAVDRKSLLKKLFFSSSSPLKGEADNWFLREFRGRYDAVLQQIARQPGSTHAEIEAAISTILPHEGKQVSAYLKILADRYEMVERRLPIFAKQKARAGRYYIKDNFLTSWLVALQRPVSAVHFRPEELLINQADQLLFEVEGYALEVFVAKLYEELSRKGKGDFPLSECVNGFWDRANTEIDLVAISEDRQCIRFGTCKRNPEKLTSSSAALKRNAKIFLSHHPKYEHWQIEYMAISPSIPPKIQTALEQEGIIAQSLSDLWTPLLPATAGSKKIT